MAIVAIFGFILLGAMLCEARKPFKMPLNEGVLRMFPPAAPRIAVADSDCGFG
jgi:hypothetical protein